MNETALYCAKLSVA